MTATLKKSLGEAAAFIDESHGTDRLYDVLKTLAENGAEMLTDKLATIATGLLSGFVVDKPSKLIGLRTSVGVCGTADSTTVQVLVNSVSKGELTTANDDADGTKKSLVITPLALAAGDLVQLNVSAAPTAGEDLVATVRMQPVTVE